MNNTETKILYNRLAEHLKEAFRGSWFTVGPRSPKKEKDGTEFTLLIRDEKNHGICGIQVQVKEGPYKIWFDSKHSEWERLTDCNILKVANNGKGLGSGAGFYMENEDECVEEALKFAKRYYPEFF